MLYTSKDDSYSVRWCKHCWDKDKWKHEENNDIINAKCISHVCVHLPYCKRFCPLHSNLIVTPFRRIPTLYYYVFSTFVNDCRVTRWISQWYLVIGIQWWPDSNHCFLWNSFIYTISCITFQVKSTEVQTWDQKQKHNVLSATSSLFTSLVWRYTWRSIPVIGLLPAQRVTSHSRENTICSPTWFHIWIFKAASM